MSEERMKVYFPGLNGLRFLAALAVIISHMEMVLQRTGHDTYWYWLEARMKFNGFATILTGDAYPLNFFVSLMGYCGVIFFFVLSGFLITYLLIVEKEQTGNISIKSFYVRRLLRIWPLYYLLVILGFFVLPKIHWFELAGHLSHFYENFYFNLCCYLFMAPNLAASYTLWHVPNIGHLWSIGVEEQFYLLWPLLMKFFTKTKRMIVLLIVGLIGFKAIITLTHVFSPEFTKFIGSLKFEAMAIGALGAYWLYYKKERVLRLIYSKSVQVAAYLALPLSLLLVPSAIFETLYLFLAFPFLVIIINVSSNPGSLLKLENNLFDYLGKISYGLYMYHLLVLTFVVNFVTSIVTFYWDLTFWERCVFYLLGISLTVFVSAISYRFFEKPFISMKRKYTRIVSGDQAKEIQ